MMIVCKGKIAFLMIIFLISFMSCVDSNSNERLKSSSEDKINKSNSEIVEPVNKKLSQNSNLDAIDKFININNLPSLSKNYQLSEIMEKLKSSGLDSCRVVSKKLWKEIECKTPDDISFSVRYYEKPSLQYQLVDHFYLNFYKKTKQCEDYFKSRRDLLVSRYGYKDYICENLDDSKSFYKKSDKFEDTIYLYVDLCNHSYRILVIKVKFSDKKNNSIC